MYEINQLRSQIIAKARKREQLYIRIFESILVACILAMGAIAACSI